MSSTCVDVVVEDHERRREELAVAKFLAGYCGREAGLSVGNPTRTESVAAGCDGARVVGRWSVAEGILFQVRRATAADAAAVADMYVRSRQHAVPDIPPLRNGDAPCREWLVGVVLSDGEVWLAEAENAVVGVMLLEEDWIEQLYVDPSWIGRGIGTKLLDVAKSCRPEGLQLWTFQSNRRAHRFYERHGFVPAERTDGSGNQEQAPDVRYVWRPS